MIDGAKTRVLSENDVTVSSAPVRVGGVLPVERPVEPEESCEAAVREIRAADGTLTEIHVQCSCGNTTVVVCEYQSIQNPA